jgi:hypothetical protein
VEVENIGSGPGQVGCIGHAVREHARFKISQKEEEHAVTIPHLLGVCSTVRRKPPYAILSSSSRVGGCKMLANV